MWIWLVALVLLLVSSLRRTSFNERGVVVRFGQRTNRIIGPGVSMVLPFVDRVDRVSIDRFEVSLPPQAAITEDEIPIQLQASLAATVSDPEKAVLQVRDWRIYLVSQAQTIMKDMLEEVKFRDLNQNFDQWKESIADKLRKAASAIGITIESFEVSNLSPKSLP